MSKLNEYTRKKAGFDNLDNIRPYESVGITGRGFNMPEYIIKLKTNGSSPECSWLYAAICEHWEMIKETMKKVGAIDVNKTKEDAAKEARDFLGLVINESNT